MLPARAGMTRPRGCDRLGRGEVAFIIRPSGTDGQVHLPALPWPAGDADLSQNPHAGAGVCDAKTDLSAMCCKIGRVFQSFNLLGHCRCLAMRFESSEKAVLDVICYVIGWGRGHTPRSFVGDRRCNPGMLLAIACACICIGEKTARPLPCRGRAVWHQIGSAATFARRGSPRTVPQALRARQAARWRGRGPWRWHRNSPASR